MCLVETHWILGIERFPSIHALSNEIDYLVNFVWMLYAHMVSRSLDYLQFIIIRVKAYP